jgi:YidC/Oxa1 family membrane protein insertase
MVAGGTLWFPDLTVADPWYLLPALCSASFLLTVELGVADGMQGMSENKGAKNFMRFLAVLMGFLTYTFPAVMVAEFPPPPRSP